MVMINYLPNRSVNRIVKALVGSSFAC